MYPRLGSRSAIAALVQARDTAGGGLELFGGGWRRPAPPFTTSHALKMEYVLSLFEDRALRIANGPVFEKAQ